MGFGEVSSDGDGLSCRLQRLLASPQIGQALADGSQARCEIGLGCVRPDFCETPIDGEGLL
jgi:hypothetical protein